MSQFLNTGQSSPGLVIRQPGPAAAEVRLALGALVVGRAGGGGAEVALGLRTHEPRLGLQEAPPPPRYRHQVVQSSRPLTLHWRLVRGRGGVQEGEGGGGE